MLIHFFLSIDDGWLLTRSLNVYFPFFSTSLSSSELSSLLSFKKTFSIKIINYRISDAFFFRIAECLNVTLLKPAFQNKFRQSSEPE